MKHRAEHELTRGEEIVELVGRLRIDDVDGVDVDAGFGTPESDPAELEI